MKFNIIKRALLLLVMIGVTVTMMPVSETLAESADGFDVNLIFTIDGTEQIKDTVPAGSEITANFISGSEEKHYISTYQIFVSFNNSKLTVKKADGQYINSLQGSLSDSNVVAGRADSSNSILRAVAACRDEIQINSNDVICSFKFDVNETMTAYELASYLTVVAQNAESPVEINGIERCASYFANDADNSQDGELNKSGRYVTNFKICPCLSASMNTGEKVYPSTKCAKFKSQISVRKYGIDGSKNVLGADDYALFRDGGYNIAIGADEIICENVSAEAIIFIKSNDGMTADFKTSAVSEDSIKSISVSTPPAKVSYAAYDFFDKTGMIVTATYESGLTADITSQCELLPQATVPLTVADKTLTISYENMTTSLPITVSKRKIVKPEVRSDELTYNGKEQIISYSTLPIPMFATVTGTTKATSAGTYSAEATLSDKENTVWSDDSDSNVSLSWNIKQGTYSGIVTGAAVASIAGEKGKSFSIDELNLPSEFENAEIITASLPDGIVTDAVPNADCKSAIFDTSSAGNGETGSFSLTIRSKNYLNYIVKVTVTASPVIVDDATWNKVSVISGDIVYGTSNGAVVSIAEDTYTARDSAGNALTGTLTVKNPDEIQDAGATVITVVFKVGESAGSEYAGMEIEKKYSVSIAPLVAEIVWNTANSNDGTSYSKAYDYNGALHGIYPYVANASAGDSFNIITVDNEAINAGIRTANIIDLGNSNYSLTATSKSWQIKQKPITTLMWTEQTDFIHTGSTITVTAGIGAAELCGADVCGISTYMGNSKTDIGQYTAIATGLTNSNYTLEGCSNSSKQWMISEDTIKSIEITSPPSNTVYEAYDCFDKTGMTVTATYRSSATENITSSCSFSLGEKDKLKITDTNVVVSCVGLTANQPITVNKRSIAKPEADSKVLTYDGTEKSFAYLSAPDEEYVTLAGDLKGKGTGTYRASATLKDTSNTAWNDGTAGTVSLAWNIQKGTFTGTLTGTAISSAVGTTNKKISVDDLNIPADFGNPQIKSVSAQRGIISSATVASDSKAVVFNTVQSAPEETGSITVTVGSDNYNDCSAVITVTAKNVTLDTATADKIKVQDSIVYGTSNEKIISIDSGSYAAKDSENKVLNGTLTVENPDAVQDAGERTVKVVFTVTSEGLYKGASFEVPYVVNVLPLEAELNWNTTNSISGATYSKEYDFDGSTHGIYPFVKNAKQDDVFSIAVSGNEGLNAGNYTANVTGLGNANYSLPSVSSRTWSIKPKNVAVNFSSLEKTEYNGADQSSSLKALISIDSGVNGENIVPTVSFSGKSGIPKDAGSYTAEVSIAAVTGGHAQLGNYQLSGAARKDFTINPKPLTSLSWSAVSLEYTGTEKAIYAAVLRTDLIGLDKCTVTKYVSNSAVNVGSYTAEATGLDNGNYTLSGCKNAKQEYQITKPPVNVTVSGSGGSSISAEWGVSEIKCSGIIYTGDIAVIKIGTEPTDVGGTITLKTDGTSVSAIKSEDSIYNVDTSDIVMIPQSIKITESIPSVSISDTVSIVAAPAVNAALNSANKKASGFATSITSAMVKNAENLTVSNSAILNSAYPSGFKTEIKYYVKINVSECSTKKYAMTITPWYEVNAVDNKGVLASTPLQTATQIGDEQIKTPVQISTAIPILCSRIWLHKTPVSAIVNGEKNSVTSDGGMATWQMKSFGTVELSTAEE